MVGGVSEPVLGTAAHDVDAVLVPVLSLTASLDTTPKESCEFTWMGGGLHPRIAARFARGDKYGGGIESASPKARRDV